VKLELVSKEWESRTLENASEKNSNARREDNTGGSDGAEEFLNGNTLVLLERSTGNRDEGVDGERLGRFGHPAIEAISHCSWGEGKKRRKTWRIGKGKESDGRNGEERGMKTHWLISQIKPTRSPSFSPSPMIPPEQTLMPADLTASIVSNRSSNLRVVMTCEGRRMSPSAYKMGERGKGKIGTHLGVVLARSVEVVVVSRQTSVLQPSRLLRGEHTESRADLHVESTAEGKDQLRWRRKGSDNAEKKNDGPDSLDHLQDPLETTLPPAHVPPCGSHAEPRRAILLCLARLTV
jgi:hypothetical protein